MYVDLIKKEVTRRPDGEAEEHEEKYEKVFLAKVRAAAAERSWDGGV